MKAKNEIAVYILRDTLDSFTRSHEFTELCLKKHYGFVPSIVRTEKGKPCFSDPDLGSFSLSHSADVFVLAVFEGGQVGIDVEVPKAGKDYSRLARKYCAECEKETDFFRVWTAKESSCKLTGEGLGGISKVKVSLSPYQAEVQGFGRVYLYDLTLAAGVPCTLAADKEVTWKVNDL